MKILFISEILDWSYFEQILTEEKPDVLLIDASWSLPRFYGSFVNEGLHRLLFHARNSEKEQEFIIKVSIVRFYSALQYAGRNSKVFVVGGHGWPEETLFPKCAYPFFKLTTYDSSKIDFIRNCREISGKTLNVDGLKLLGLGCQEFGYLDKLNPILKDAQANPPDIVIADMCLERGKREPRREMICRLLKPKLFISGGIDAPPTRKWQMNGGWIAEGCGGFPRLYVVIKTDANVIRDVELKYYLCNIQLPMEPNSPRRELYERTFERNRPQ
jgi:hypothetical protein